MLGAIVAAASGTPGNRVGYRRDPRHEIARPRLGRPDPPPEGRRRAGALDLRRPDPAAALEGIEAIWQIARSRRRSAGAALAADRDGPGSFGRRACCARSARRRTGGRRGCGEGEFLQGFLAAFQNDAWPSADHPGMAGDAETLTRIYRRFADGLVARSPCAWTATDLQHSWDVAISGETDPNEIVLTISSDSIIRRLMRLYRFLFDSELTALVLDARAERAASREDEWPSRLPDLESQVCPGRFYRLRAHGRNDAAFEGPAPGTGEPTADLPPTFHGAPAPTRTPTPTPTAAAALTPTPPPHTLRRAMKTRVGFELVVAGGDPVGRRTPCRFVRAGRTTKAIPGTPGPNGLGGF